MTILFSSTFIILFILLHFGTFFLSLLVPLLLVLVPVRRAALKLGRRLHEAGRAPVVGDAGPDGCNVGRWNLRLDFLKVFLLLLYFYFLFMCSYILTAVLCDLWKNHRTSFYYLPANALTHCMAGVLRKVDSIRCKELGMQTGRSSPQIE